MINGIFRIILIWKTIHYAGSERQRNLIVLITDLVFQFVSITRGPREERVLDMVGNAFKLLVEL